MQTISATIPTSARAETDSPARTAPLTDAGVLASFRGPPHAFVDVGHSRLAYRRFGAGPDVLFIHGWPMSSATYRALVPLFAGSFTCHLLDLPGAGQTESDGDAPVDTMSQAATVRRAIDALGLGRYGLVGQDSGGFVARLVAEDPRAAGLVLANTEIPGYRSFALRLFIAGARSGRTDTLLRLLRFRFIREMNTMFGGAFFDTRLMGGEFHELFVEPILTSAERRRGVVRAAEAFDIDGMDRLDAAHAKIRCPSLLIWGTEDPFFPLAPARAMLPQFAGGARLVEIPRAKLLVYEEHPRAFAEHAVPFLREALGAA